MKAEEVRIGIWLQYCGQYVVPEAVGAPVQVDDDIMKDIFVDRRQDSFEGIPLTPELL